MQALLTTRTSRQSHGHILALPPEAYTLEDRHIARSPLPVPPLHPALLVPVVHTHLRPGAPLNGLRSPSPPTPLHPNTPKPVPGEQLRSLRLPVLLALTSQPLRQRLTQQQMSASRSALPPPHPHPNPRGHPPASRNTALTASSSLFLRHSLSSLRASSTGPSVTSTPGASSPRSTRARSSGLAGSLRLNDSERKRAL